MTDMEMHILSKFKNRSPIDRHDLITVEALQELGLIKIDTLYSNNVNGVIIHYATITNFGLQVISTIKWYHKIPLLKIFFKT